MWAFNVARSVMAQAGHRVLPETVPLTDQEMLSIAKAALQGDAADGAVHCLKLDTALLKPHQAARFIVTYRDIRDAMFSLMKFVRCDFDQALEISQTMMGVVDHYEAFDPAVMLKLRYDDIVGDPTAEVSRIARFLGLKLAPDTLATVAAQWSRDNVRRMIDRSDATARAGNTAANVVLATYRDGTARVFDRATGFQTGHVSTGASGEWRTVFTADQKRRLLRTTADWLTRHGFDL